MLSYPSPDLTDGVVRLRSWNDDDLDCVREASQDARIVEGTTVPPTFSAEAGRAFLDRQHARVERGEGVSLAIGDAASGLARGLLWLAVRPQRGVVGVGFWLVPTARGHGLAMRAVRLAADWTLREHGAARVEAWVEPDNQASQRVLRGAGFEQEGVLRSFLDFGTRRADAVVFSRIAL